ncbi:hypothetical protein BD289DRAFT_445058 [Coniella lustricola]|uniref:Uncharacterized protein n=1 Tax=Coniella lustricola TaxID=2025994 RepID=A0A2T2ZVA4_9PEZI|nr:hypothetical protein BD289DRAFT_445058 [Coniella lustricola]
MRQQIADAERARRGLAAENQDMRARFAGPSTSTSTSAVPAVVLVSGGGDDGLAYGEEEEKADDQLVHSQEHRQMETEPYPFAAASPSLLLAQQQQDLMLYPAHPSLSLQSAEDLLVLVLQQQQQQQQKQENYFGAGVAGFQMGLDQTLEPPHLPLRKESDFFSIPVSEQELHNVFPITTTTATTTTISTNYFDPASSSTSSTSTMTAHSLAAPAGVAYQAGYPSPSLQYHQFIDSSSGMGTGMGIETETETHTETPAPYLYPDLLEEVQQQQRNMGGTWDSMDYVFS